MTRKLPLYGNERTLPFAFIYLRPEDEKNFVELLSAYDLAIGSVGIFGMQILFSI